MSVAAVTQRLNTDKADQTDEFNSHLSDFVVGPLQRFAQMPLQ